ncbi:MAG: putative F420-dependent oxidoreductase [Candidatus Azotimanducaceae bacterium]
MYYWHFSKPIWLKKGVNMEFGISAFMSDVGMQPFELASKAEALGFESFFVSEHTHIPLSTNFPIADEVPKIYKSMYDPFVAMAAAASATTKIRVGNAICILPQHDVFNCAKSIATIDHISGGRVTFGIGAGWNEPEMENHGVAFKDRFAVTKESLEAIKLLWTQDVAEYHGKHINFDPCWTWPKPSQAPYPELLLAGAGPSILKRTARLADGWMPVFAMEWHESLAGKQSPLDNLAQDRQTLRELDEQLGKTKTSISAMGLPAVAKRIDYLMEHDVERMILSVPNDSREMADEYLNQYASVISEYLP